jgi:hypothetical protein
MTVPALAPRGAGRRWRAVLAAAAAAWLLGLTAEAAPHLVHHLFDAEGTDGCQYLAVADQDSATLLTPSVDGPTADAAPVAVSMDGHAPAPARGLVAARGPPVASLA